jgi:hypothetical protein
MGTAGTSFEAKLSDPNQTHFNDKSSPKGSSDDGDSWESHYEWDLTTALVELVVQIKGAWPDGVDYDSWLPKGMKTGDKRLAGNALLATANLKAKGDPPGLPKAKKIRFQLVDVSKQPGVCINFPPYADKSNLTFDLQFDPQFNPTLYVLSDSENQAAETKEGGASEATVNISCYDFGAYGVLLVTAEMPDGSTLVGHLIGDPAKQSILLPKRKPDSRIADYWKHELGIDDWPDTYDEENIPVGNKVTGDGLTLYEEYRGAIIGANHIRLVTKENLGRKKLFIYNNIQHDTIYVPAGVDAATIRAELVNGIKEFSRLTQIWVYDQLLRGELPDDRVINSNSDTGHAQHGLVFHSVENITDVGKAWAFIDPKDPDKMGPPGEHPVVWFTTGSDKFTPASIATGIILYTVVHELGHCVNIHHHTTAMTGEEETEYQKLKGGDFGLAVRGGMFSGDRWCPMRYRGPSYYTDGTNIYSWTPTDDLMTVTWDKLGSLPGQADDDFQIRGFCTNIAGTDFNASNRQPRPRAGDCGHTFGPCMSQIQVKDNG